MAAKMTQSQLVKELAEAAGTSGKVAKLVLEKYAVIAVRETKKGGLFVLPGIGRLVRVERKARMGRNPATGEAIKIPAKRVVNSGLPRLSRTALSRRRKSRSDSKRLPEVTCPVPPDLPVGSKMLATL